MRRHIAVVAVVALVALAGCSGALVGDDGSDDSSGEPAQNDQAPTLESVAYPDGYDEAGVTDTQAALDSHNESVADVRDFHLSASMRTTVESQDGSSRSLELSLERTVDNDAGTEYSRLELSQGSSETYRTADGQTYVRISDGSNVQYDTSRPDAASTVSVANFRGVLDSAALSADSVRTEGSTTLITYTADAFEDGQYENVAVELVVDAEGRIHSLSVSYDVPDGADVDAEFAFDYDDATVEEPDWLDEAREETS